MVEQFLSGNRVVLIASVVMGFSVMWFLFGLFSILFRARLESAKEWEFEDAQWVKLRQDSAVMRWFEPLVKELRPLVAKLDEKQREEYSRQIALAGESTAWSPPELFLAACLFQGLLVGLGAALFGYLISDGMTALVLFLICAWGYQQLLVKQVRSRANRKLWRMKSRLPYAMDLMAFMMEAGAGFFEALQTVVTENRDHVVGDEFAHVLHEVELGRSRQTALEHFGSRLRDTDIDELVFAINKGEEMGTPLSDILRLQADQMRLKHSQWMERAAGEAEVMIVFPGMLIMLTCLAIVMAPFILPALE